MNRSDGNPAADSAAISAQEPGTGTTRIPSACAWRTRWKPGSEISGVPASEISATSSPLQPGDEAPALLALVVLVAGRQWRLDAEVLEQPDRMAGILRSHQGHLPQHPQGARADVVEIADRGRHYEQSAC